MELIGGMNHCNYSMLFLLRFEARSSKVSAVRLSFCRRVQTFFSSSLLQNKLECLLGNSKYGRPPCANLLRSVGFNSKILRKQANLIRRSTVQSIPFPWVFPALSLANLSSPLDSGKQVWSTSLC